MNDIITGSRPVVLVVDDDAECGATIEFALQAIPGIDVVLAASAERAREVLQEGPRPSHADICAVITDLQLPNMTGLEMIGWIRTQTRFRDLPIIVISAATDPSAPARAVQLGATAFFAKPFSPSAVRQRLRELLELVPHVSHQETKHA